jgi:hypothetical protein
VEGGIAFLDHAEVAALEAEKDAEDDRIGGEDAA